MGRIGCPETSLRKYHYLLRNNREERISLLVWNKFMDPSEEPAGSFNMSVNFFQIAWHYISQHIVVQFQSDLRYIHFSIFWWWHHNCLPIISENELAPSLTWIPTVKREFPIWYSFLGKGVVKWMSQWSQGHLSDTSSVLWCSLCYFTSVVFFSSRPDCVLCRSVLFSCIAIHSL